MNLICEKEGGDRQTEGGTDRQTEKKTMNLYDKEKERGEGGGGGRQRKTERKRETDRQTQKDRKRWLGASGRGKHARVKQQ